MESKKVVTSGPVIPSIANAPLDIRTRVNTIDDIYDIELPYVGMIVYVLDEDKYYKIKTLKSKEIGLQLIEDAAVDTFEEFLIESSKGDQEEINSIVTTDNISDNAITTPKIANEAVTTPKIKYRAVTTDKIGDSAITTSKIDDSAITTIKIDDNAITTAKINDSAVTTSKILSGAVTTIKIGNNAVTTDKILNSAVTTAKIKDYAVVEYKIADNAVTRNKLSVTLRNELDEQYNEINKQHFEIISLQQEITELRVLIEELKNNNLPSNPPAVTPTQPPNVIVVDDTLRYAIANREITSESNVLKDYIKGTDIVGIFVSPRIQRYTDMSYLVYSITVDNNYYYTEENPYSDGIKKIFEVHDLTINIINESLNIDFTFTVDKLNIGDPHCFCQYDINNGATPEIQGKIEELRNKYDIKNPPICNISCTLYARYAPPADQNEYRVINFEYSTILNDSSNM